MTDALLGEEHRRIVDLLLGRLEEITDPDCRSPRVVVLRGHSGVGKTRIIQELYERLRSDRGDDYWPQMTPVVREPLGGGVDPMAARKLVAPVLDDFSWPAGVLPSFGWWGLNCERMAVGGHVDVLGAAQVQLAAHTLPLLLARRDEASVGDQLQRLGQDAVVQVQKVFKEEGKNALLELLKGIGVAFPFAGSVLSLGLNGLRVLGKRQENRARLGRDIDLGAESAWARRSAGEELAEALVGMAHTRLPAVLAVEDVHHMSEEVGRLLTTVASRSSAPVLVVATLWPEGQERPVYQD